MIFTAAYLQNVHLIGDKMKESNIQSLCMIFVPMVLRERIAMTGTLMSSRGAEQRSNQGS